MPDKYVAPSREGLVALTVFVRPEVRHALKIKAATDNSTVAGIVIAAVEAALSGESRREDEADHQASLGATEVNVRE